MAMIDISFQRKSCLDDSLLLGQLPSELLQIIQHGHGGNFLDAVAIAALEPRLTAPLYVHFENVFPDICARWVQSHGDSSQSDEVVAAFARILPFSPNLSVFLEHYLQQTSGLPPNDLRRLRLISLDCDEVRRPWQDATALQRSLLAVWRLLHFDKETFRQLVRPSRVQPLLDHPNKAVRYLAILVLCKLLGASDFRLEALVKQHVGDSGPSTGDFDGETIDYAFLSLCEKQRAHEIHRRQASLRNADRASTPAFPEQRLTPFVIKYGQSLLPRPKGPGVGAARTSCLVSTPTTLANLENLAKLLQQPEPILLCGPAGCGKTSLVHQVARDLEVESSMITLHLNEQTDAKVLIGLYSTGSKPGTFQWRPGVLTRAVKEGRWVLIEDLDRAPNEIMGTLLSLIERRELLIPGRGERVRAPSSFRLFATIRASRDAEGSVALPHILGLRFWKLLQVQTTPQNELRDIIQQTNPILHRMLPVILSVYQSVTSVPQRRGTSSIARAAIDRNASLRDLLKWCRRLTAVMESVGARTGDEAVSETVQDSMFLEAVDCFAGNIQSEKARLELIRLIAKEMRISPEKVDHFVSTYTPRLEDSDSALFVGRVMLRKRRHDGRVPKSKRPFASTTHAKRLLEQISAAVRMAEPVLLVGETGIGKTTVVQQLAESLGRNLVVVNLSQQSEVGDLLGGFKPVNVRTLAIPLKEEFEDLFRLTGISASKNQKYLEQIGRSAAKGQWSRVSRLWREAPKMFSKILEDLSTRSSNDVSTREEDGQRQKRRKTESRLQTLLELKPRWELFARDLDQFDVQLSGGSSAFAFAFVEGNIVKAVRNGDWVLLDEVNLASPDTLESIVDLLQSGPIGNPSILLSETGEIERINAHPDFRIFGSMNPATDVGKRDLPPGIRSRFTEIYVGSPDRDLRDLLPIIKSYLKGTSSKDNQAADDIARLYLNTKALADEKRIVDGANEVPHFSLRTLTRVLTYVNDVSPFYGLRRALFEGFSMGFLTLLDQDSEKMVTPLIYHHIFDKHGDPQSLLSQKPKQPADGREYVRFVNKNRDRQYWLLKGERPPQERPDYIITPYVERNLLNLVRAISTRRFPILIQGPTSSGKTSMIQYLANYTGNVFVRINNHEHTDLQEYLGTYVSDSDGRLTFQDGLLVQALRKGYWIVLDELNLAPTDVLEALNRLLDDNRELLIPETQEVVRPHDRFMLFATQNPPGLYGGRKVLSRAFRNRFLELHFDDIPESELEYILQKRSINTSPPDCKRIVTVYKELSRLRQTSRVFEQKDSFATLRDLFRWALRKADYREDIANNGYMLLAERVRNQEERLAVKRIIEDVFKVKIDDKKLYDPSSSPYLATAISKIGGDGVVWTSAMRRLFVLVSAALANNEPVLLVGETGCGKTTVCQLLADVSGKQLHIVNAHRNTETGDLIGSQRPVRNRTAILDNLKEELVQALGLDGSERRSVDALLEQYRELVSQQPAAVPAELQARIKALETRSKALFEWSDGSLVHALKDGNYFLLDEISLADDSVLERLNSVLEPHRSLLLAEKGAEGSFVEAADGFQFMATMNPGGDFGKKELSPALRNRFTEIWVPPLSEQDDILEIVTSKLREPFKPFAETIVAFAHWFGKEFRPLSSTAFSIRDILVWIKFINGSGTADPAVALLHGAATVFIDTLGANPSALLAIDARTMNAQRQKCLEYLSSLVHKDLVSVYRAQPEISMDADSLRVGDFRLPRDPGLVITDDSFAMHAPTTKLNLMRVARALQIDRPILLEGSPGVGKTTLVAALANACGRPLTRINLSDQTDLMDLFGTDVPVEGAEAGVFAWRDAPFLQAMQSGGWVLLDEMNLAPQTVLEGLNACLDHRGEVYIAELNRVFKCHKDFRLFAAQNPHHQGGGRKGLPSSFVNRFVVVYADVFQEEDLLLIVRHNLPRLPVDTVRSTIRFVSALEHETVVRKTLGADGSPWELNLRDILRWLSISDARDPLLRSARIDDFLEMMISQRFRSPEDRLIVRKLFTEIFGRQPADRELYHNIDSSFAQVGVALLSRESDVSPTAFPGIDIVPRLAEIESVMICVKQNMPCILTGPSGSGKTALLQHVAAVAGKELVVFSLNADIDAMDLIGGFEQSDPMREVNMMLESLREELRLAILKSSEDLHKKGRVLELLFLLDMYRGERNELDKIFELVDAVNSCEIAPGSLPDTLKKLETALEQSLAPGNPRFEWLDGVIVKALERGDWLVLDNANLCSSAVLDRLNSLLEPNGTLSINEHSGPDGEPRLLRPHRDFRIFLTMDPRYGELSRAMRNRSVEVFIGGDHPPQHSWERRVVQPQAALSRFEMARKLLSQSHVGEVVDHRLSTLTVGTLSSGDMSHLSSFHRMLEDGKLSLYAPGRGTLSKHLELMATSTNSGRGSRISEAAEDLYRLLRGACESMTGETWGCDHSFETAQVSTVRVPPCPIMHLTEGSLWIRL